MVRYKSALTLLFLVVSFVFSYAQTTDIKGVVIDEKRNGVDLAMVALQRKSDSTFVKAQYTDVDGSYKLAKIEAGEYFLQVTLLGYEPHQQSLSVATDNNPTIVPPITLNVSTSQLDEVTVTAKVPYIERKIDRTVVNVDALISNEGSDALEALERAPGIQLDNDGNILLKGRGGVAVFINDKPSYLSGTELESYLKSLPAGTVKQIEIMTNPPAKYDAAGNSGVINIILKKNMLRGFHGNLSLSYRKGVYQSSNNSMNLNYNHNKIGLYANLAGGFWNSYQDLNINRHYKNEAGAPLSSFAQNSYGQNNGKYGNATVGMDYYVTDKTTVGVSFKSNNSPSQRNIDNTARVTDALDNLTQRVVADNVTDATFNNQLINAYFNHKIDSLGSSISVDADYVTYTSGSDQVFLNYIYAPNDSLTFQDQINGNLPSTISIYAGKTDYTKPFKNGSKLDAGLKVALTKTDNEAEYSTTVEGVTTPDYQLSNRFLYDEWINAGYVNYSRAFGRVSIQAGLRVESTRMEGHQLGNVENPDTSFTRNYTNLFPTLYTSWQVDSLQHHILTFSYGRRINRPFFQDLNPFISPLDKFTFYSGNPNLLPTFSHNFSLAHTFKGAVTTTLNYSKTLDGINETLEIRDGIYYSRPGNIANSETMSVSVQASIPVTKWYNINSYLELSHLNFQSPLYTEQLDSKGTYYYLSATNTFRMKKGWSADLTALYRSDLVYAQLELLSYGQVNVGVKKNILNGAGTLKASVSDIFKTRRGDGIINNLSQTEANWNSTFDSRRLTLAFSYRFGKNTLRKPKYNSNGSSEEQNRVKS